MGISLLTGDKVRVGNAIYWEWTVFNDGNGQIMPRGSATNWTGV